MKRVLHLFSSKWFLIIILLISIIIRLCWIFIFNTTPTGDAEWYYQAACYLADGNGYNYQGAASAFYPPGYPFFLAFFFMIFGKSILLAKVLNVFLSGIVLWAIWLLGHKILENNIAAGISVFLLAFYPNHIAYCNLLNNELFFLTLFIVALYFQLLALKSGNKFHFILAGLFFGLSCLTRPATLLVPLVIFFFDFIRKYKKLKFKDCKLVPIFILTFILVILPWQIRNHKVINHFVFISTSFNHNLLVGNHPGAKGNFVLMNDYLKQFPPVNTEMEYDSFALHQAIKYIKENPKEAFGRIPSKIYYFLWPGMDGISWNLNGVSKRQYHFLHKFRFLSNGYYLLLLISFTIIILYRLFDNKNKLLFEEWMFLVIMIYYLSICIILFGESRYHFHLVPLAIWFISERISKLSELKSSTQ